MLEDTGASPHPSGQLLGAPWQNAMGGIYGANPASAALNSTNLATLMAIGVGAMVGAMYRLGPGSVWLEAGYAWAPVSHLVTSDASLSNVTLALGYRLAL